MDEAGALRARARTGCARAHEGRRGPAADALVEVSVKRTLLWVVLVGCMVAVWPGRLRADGAWLDAPLVPWNTPGMAVPAAPPDGLALADPRCGRQQRPPETAEDDAVVAAGWVLFNAYQSGWGVRVIDGLAGYDGMCRPMGYQGFVFVDGVFAGTVSPVPMASRFDGAGRTAVIQPPGDELSAVFARYTKDDPLCCPSAASYVTYRIDRVDGSPVLVPVSASTTPNSGTG